MSKSRKKRSHRGSPPPLAIAILTAILASAAVFLVLRHARRAGRERVHPAVHRQIPRRLPPSARDHALERFRLAIERAGGQDVWVRQSSSSFMSALLLPAAYPATERAIGRAAREQSLRVRQITARPDASGLRTIATTAYAGRNVVCRWTMREVPQIPRVAIVVDDLGQNLQAARDLLRLRSPLTFSVMPRLPHSRETAEEAHRDGIEVMLHLPMQPLDDSAPDVSRWEIKVGMKRKEVDEIIQDDLASVPHAAGVNNHMGSKATSDLRLMDDVMECLAGRHLYYIDSRTIASSVAFEAARRAGLPAFYRSVFLDDTRSVPYTLGQLRRLCLIAKERGATLAIGHPYPSTIAALAQFLPELQRQNIQLVRVSELLKLREVARLSASHASRRLVRSTAGPQPKATAIPAKAGIHHNDPGSPL